MHFSPIFFTIAMLSAGSANALTLVCDITPVVDQGSADISPSLNSRILESWLQPKQAFQIDLKKRTITDLVSKRKTDLNVLDNKRFKWKYIRNANDSRKTNFERIIYQYTYIQKTKKLFVDVDFGGNYVGIKSSRPKCVEQ